MELFQISHKTISKLVDAWGIGLSISKGFCWNRSQMLLLKLKAKASNEIEGKGFTTIVSSPSLSTIYVFGFENYYFLWFFFHYLCHANFVHFSLHVLSFPSPFLSINARHWPYLDICPLGKKLQMMVNKKLGRMYIWSRLSSSTWEDLWDPLAFSDGLCFQPTIVIGFLYSKWY